MIMKHVLAAAVVSAIGVIGFTNAANAALVVPHSAQKNSNLVEAAYASSSNEFGLGGGPVDPPTLTPASSVPEPATWAMMLIGFSLVGLRLHRRSAVAA